MACSRIAKAGLRRMKGQKRLPHKHAFGPLQTARDPGLRSKLTRNRVRRWAKRVTRKDWEWPFFVFADEGPLDE